MGFMDLFYCKPICCHKESTIISKKSLRAVQELVGYLQNNLEDLGIRLFRVGAIIHQETVNLLLQALKKGSIETIRRLLASGRQLEGAEALYLFLSQLKQPLLPESIQALVLGDTSSVSADIVATDVVGLIRQDLSLRHLQLITIILRLLNQIIKFSPSDELRGYNLPLCMLELFFNIQEMNMKDLRKIALIFLEVIRKGIDTLRDVISEIEIERNSFDSQLQPSTSNNSDIVNQYIADELLNQSDIVVRSYIHFVGHRGDCSNIEVVYI